MLYELTGRWPVSARWGLVLTQPDLPSPDRRALDEAERALAAGDSVAAERLAAALAVRHPHFARLHRLIATARRRSGDAKGALSAYQAAEALTPGDPDLLVDHASLLDRLGAFDGAITRYRRALVVVPAHDQALLGLSAALKHAERLDGALALLSGPAATSSRDHRLSQMKGAILRELGESDRAAKAFDEALRLAPSDAAALHGRARAEQEAGRPAASFFSRARRIHPHDRALLLSASACAASEGRADEAIAELERDCRHAPDWIEGQVTLARLRWQHQGRDGFDRGFREGLSTLPRCGPLWAAWLGAVARAEDHGRVAQIAASARAAIGASATIDRIEAASASMSGDIARADALFARMPLIADESIALRLAHLLRARRPGEAAALGEGLLGAGTGPLAFPYLDVAWRLIGNKRAQWLSQRPEFVSEHRLDIDLEALADHLRGLHLARHAPIDQSLRSGTQSEGPLLSRDDPIIRQLRAAVTDAAELYAAALPHDPKHPFLSRRAARLRVRGSWSVRLTDDGFHLAHVHSQGWISSAFYVALPAAIGPSEKEPGGWLTIGEPPPDLGHGLGPLQTVRPEPGLLVMFPSVMWHGTRPFGTGERLTAAFDFVPRLA